jgi:predicted dehydrogenase
MQIFINSTICEKGYLKFMKVAFIGAGRVAEVHYLALKDIPEIQLVGIYDNNKEQSAKRAAEWSVNIFDSVSNLLADSQIDAILILTHVDSHIELAQACLQAGKHVFIEKPVSVNSTEIRGLIKLAKLNNRVIMPGHNYAYIPEFTRMKKLLSNGSLGTVRAVFVNYVIRHPENVVKDYAGVIDEVMIHHTYLITSLLGVPRQVVAGAAETAWKNHPVEDQGWMTFDYGIATAHAFCTFGVDDISNSPWTFLIKVIGTEGTAVVDWRSSVFLRPLGTLPIAIVQYEESYTNELLAFKLAIENGRPLTSTMEDAALAADILSAAQKSIKTGSFVKL